MELVVAILIVGILATLALPRFNKTLETGRAQEARAALRQIRTAERVYRLKQGFYYPHFSAHPNAEDDVGTIFADLKVQLGSKSWNYSIDTTNVDQFTAEAERIGGVNVGEKITIDQAGTMDESNWTP